MQCSWEESHPSTNEISFYFFHLSYEEATVTCERGRDPQTATKLPISSDVITESKDGGAYGCINGSIDTPTCPTSSRHARTQRYMQTGRDCDLQWAVRLRSLKTHQKGFLLFFFLQICHCFFFLNCKQATRTTVLWYFCNFLMSVLQ
uniref:Uncharacterized protein n=1 Tax=Oryza brachyantha TaxID=4533 RepID=J3N2S5_ORYBR